MLEKIRELKNRKGFTLVELIVVLVILAILAALLVPALTGYIDKARDTDKPHIFCHKTTKAPQGISALRRILYQVRSADKSGYWISISVLGFSGSCFSALGSFSSRMPFSNLAATSVGLSSSPT